MSLRTRWAVAVVLAATAASVSNAIAQPKGGQGSLGARIGVPYFIADQDTRSGQIPRILLQADFQYKMSNRWRVSTEFGYGWIGYKDIAPSPYKLRDPDTGDSVSVKRDVLTKFQPIAFTLIRSLRPSATKWSPYLGGGVNITRMEIVNKRQKIKDPATFDEWVNWSPGVHGIAGTELVVGANQAVTLDWSVRWTYLFSKNTKSFPSGFTGNDSYVNANFGVNVWFWPGGKPIETAAPPVEPTPESVAPEAPATPAPPDTTPAPPPPPPPAPPDTLKAPADTTRAPTDTTQKATSAQAPGAGFSQSVLLRAPEPADTRDESTFGAFGVILPRTEDEAAACAIKEKRTTP